MGLYWDSSQLCLIYILGARGRNFLVGQQGFIEKSVLGAISSEIGAYTVLNKCLLGNESEKSDSIYFTSALAIFLGASGRGAWGGGGGGVEASGGGGGVEGLGSSFPLPPSSPPPSPPPPLPPPPPPPPSSPRP